MASMAAMASVMQNIQLPPSSMEVINMPTPPTLTGVLKPNNWLAKARKYVLNKVTGPESMVVHNRYLYTGTASGWVVEIQPGGRVRQLLRMSDGSCRTLGTEEACGRPLGIRADSNQNLVVADAYKGIFRIYPRQYVHNRASFKRLVEGGMLVKGKHVRFINDLAVTSSGVIFFTSSSSKYNRTDFFDIIVSGDKTGRVLIYDPNDGPTGQVKEMVTNLHFPNGITLSKDENYLLIAEGARARIYRAWIGPNTAKRGTIETFAENLPGFVDNIRLSPRGTYWVAISSVRTKDAPGVLDKFGDKPQIRQYIMTQMSREQAMAQAPTHGMVLELNDRGQIIRSLQDPEGLVFSAVSEVEEENGILFIGSYNKKFVGTLDMKNLPPPVTPAPTPGPGSGGGGRPPTPPLPPPTSTNPLVKFLNQIRANAQIMTLDRLRKVVLMLVERLIEAQVEVRHAVERANRLQNDLNDLNNIMPSNGVNGTVVTSVFNSNSGGAASSQMAAGGGPLPSNNNNNNNNNDLPMSFT